MDESDKNGEKKKVRKGDETEEMTDRERPQGWTEGDWNIPGVEYADVRKGTGQTFREKHIAELIFYFL